MDSYTNRTANKSREFYCIFNFILVYLVKTESWLCMSAVRVFQYGLKVWEVQPRIIHQAHYHNEIELIYLEQGSLSYLYHAHSMILTSGDLMLFWAAIPHNIQDILDDCTMHIVTIPLDIFFRWGLTPAVVNEIMNGKPLIQPEISSQFNLVEGYFRQWQRDLHIASPERREIVLLELQALIKRLTLYRRSSQQEHLPESNAIENSTRRVYAHAIAHFIAGHYTQTITLNDIADEIKIHPSYASTLFAEEFHITIWDYLTQYRIAHAQRLLLLTDTKIKDIAYASGFTSISQFYAVFKKICKESPKKFRISARGSTT